MRWSTEHVIEAELLRVEAVALDPATLADLPAYMKSIERLELISRVERDGVVERVTRFFPTFTPPAFARGVDKEMTQWVERSRWDLRTHRCRYVIEPNIPAQFRGHFKGEGEYRLEARGAGQTARVVEGEIVIKAPLVGAIAERFAVKRVREQFDGEAAMLAAHCARRA